MTSETPHEGNDQTATRDDTHADAETASGDTGWQGEPREGAGTASGEADSDVGPQPDAAAPDEPAQPGAEEQSQSAGHAESAGNAESVEHTDSGSAKHTDSAEHAGGPVAARPAEQPEPASADVPAEESATEGVSAPGTDDAPAEGQAGDDQQPAEQLEQATEEAPAEATGGDPAAGTEQVETADRPDAEAAGQIEQLETEQLETADAADSTETPGAPESSVREATSRPRTGRSRRATRPAAAPAPAEDVSASTDQADSPTDQGDAATGQGDAATGQGDAATGQGDTPTEHGGVSTDHGDTSGEEGRASGPRDGDAAEPPPSEGDTADGSQAAPAADGAPAGDGTAAADGTPTADGAPTAGSDAAARGDGTVERPAAFVNGRTDETVPVSRPARSRRATRPATVPEPLDVLAELGPPRAETAPAPEPAAAAALGRIVFAEPTRRASSRDVGVEDQPDADEAEAETEDGEPDAEAEAGPRLPVTALLFQAPEPAATPERRRRSSTGQPEAALRFAADAAPTEESGPGGGDGPADRSDRAAGRPDRAAGRPADRTRTGDDGPADDRGTDAEPDAEPDAESSAADETTEEDGTQTPSGGSPRRRRRRGGRGRRNRGASGEGTAPDADEEDEPDTDEESAEGDEDGDEEAPEETSEESTGGTSRRRRRRRRSSRSGDAEEASGSSARSDEVTALKGSTRLEAKRQRRRDGRDAGRRRTIVTEAEFLARRESVDRAMVVREREGRTQIAVLEDGVLVEHFVARKTQTSMVGNVYLGRVQNVLPSMEAAFVDLGKGRNAVLYAGEVNWDAAGMEGQPRRIEQALSAGDSVMVQVTKDPIGHKGARLTAQITLAGRYLVLVPSGAMTGISRKLPDTERARLKKLLKEIVPAGAGVIVRTAAEGASEDELRRDVARLQTQWADIERKAKSASAPSLLSSEPDLAIRVIRDVFNEDFGSVTIAGDDAWETISTYVTSVAPDLVPRLHRWTDAQDVFAANRIDEQLAKALDRKVWLPSGGSLVIDRTEAMTVVDVNTGKFTGSGGTLEETVTRNNLEAAEEIVRQLRLRDIGGIIVIDFIDMVLESNRDLVLRRLVECLGRDRTRHQVAEVTSLGLVQMTRKRVGQGLLEAFSEACTCCNGRGYLVHSEPVERAGASAESSGDNGARSSQTSTRRRGRRGGDGSGGSTRTAARPASDPSSAAAREAVKATLATIAAAAAHAHAHDEGAGGDKDGHGPTEPGGDESEAVGEQVEPVGDETEPVGDSSTGTDSRGSAPGDGDPDAESAPPEVSDDEPADPGVGSTAPDAPAGAETEVVSGTGGGDDDVQADAVAVGDTEGTGSGPGSGVETVVDAEADVARASEPTASGAAGAGATATVPDAGPAETAPSSVPEVADQR